jgi:hypothetical protein
VVTVVVGPDVVVVGPAVVVVGPAEVVVGPAVVVGPDVVVVGPVVVVVVEVVVVVVEVVVARGPPPLGPPNNDRNAARALGTGTLRWLSGSERPSPGYSHGAW